MPQRGEHRRRVRPLLYGCRWWCGDPPCVYDRRDLEGFSSPLPLGSRRLRACGPNPLGRGSRWQHDRAVLAVLWPPAGCVASPEWGRSPQIPRSGEHHPFALGPCLGATVTPSSAGARRTTLVGEEIPLMDTAPSCRTATIGGVIDRQRHTSKN